MRHNVQDTKNFYNNKIAFSFILQNGHQEQFPGLPEGKIYN